jgi:DNA-binding CsgD family transcriptional regulator
MAEAIPHDVIIPSTAEIATVSGFSLLNHVDIVRERSGLYDAYVPLNLIYREEVPVDSEHVLELSSSMQEEAQTPEGGSGQLTPILVAEVPKEPKFPIVDGFHRTDSLYQRGEDKAYATIRPNSTWEKVYDLRILTATTHRSVRFARVVEWVNNVWAISAWADRLDATQAFAIATNGSYKGTHLKLSEQDIEGIREWTKEKCGQWKLSPGAIYKSLYTANAVAPDLIKETREGQKGRGVQKVLTQQQVTNIGSVLPHRHAIQRVVAEVAKERSLSSTETLLLAERVKNTETAAEAIEIVQNTNLQKIVTGAKKIHANGSKKASPNSIRAKEALLVDGLRLAQLSLEMHVLKGNHVPSPLNRYTANSDNPGGIDIWPSVWTENAIDSAIDSLESISDETQDRLINNGYDEVSTRGVIKASGARIVADIRSGLLRYVEVTDSAVLQGIYKHTVQDESNRRRMIAAARATANPDTGSNFTLWKTLSDTNKSHAQLSGLMKELLPDIDTNERQILILSGAMNLSSFVVGRVMGISETEIADQVKQLAHDLGGRLPDLADAPSLDTTKLLHSIQGNLHKRQEVLPLPDVLGVAENLTPRELEILRYTQNGLSNGRIAGVLYVTEQTVKFHLSNIYRKLGAENRTQAVQVAVSHGILARVEDA